ncbi:MULTISPECIES: acyl-CoA thioesterase [unclassified Arthrobacter]|uniref:acyl-CoA thioesterase n=1 Tax=unclassified Arthrobacter TaxID=235627 RepID=UPI001D1337CF|nr:MULTISPECIES: acyl-CoA thioesterase domain-containing protein [unclassified Arthrobacter]MCC3278338.1 thioesterase family protein [Arthrobacter sp. zg-Y40]MCC9176708.1 thioesterase family protein [Arthrobacter sp. zg-Y750]MCC3275262.1 thioesterase family protein [Arthrobacter sp. zg-Y20]MDK1315419.1 thioesterase family protein [Arthrobacter sp. zg.Y20]MDK1326588.1 thioesterase family protein [Arthrobacter sp. zg-Y1143]
MNSDTFLQAIELKPTVAEIFDQAYTAMPQYVPWPKAYGGDMVAQGALAMMQSAAADRRLHSMHSYFLRPVDVGIPVRYEVELLRDGRGYSTRQVRGYQNGKPVYAALGSFHVPEDGPEYEPDLPASYAGVDPESLASAADVLDGHDGDDARYWSAGRSFDMRHVPGPLYLETGSGVTAHQAVWVKAFSELPDDPAIQRAALAYVCDYTILEPLLRAHGLAWATPGLTTASLDHAMWFHRDGRVDDWVLYAQDAVSSQNNRGLAAGRFFTRDGTLLATVAQEGMIRGPRS